MDEKCQFLSLHASYLPIQVLKTSLQTGAKMKFPDGQAELSPCYQEYRMECLICGLGEDSISILPKDPRKVSQILF